MYTNGLSEEILGQLMKNKRHDLVITSKLYYPAKDKPSINDMGLSHKHMVRSLDGSLKRLQTDYIAYIG